MTRTSTELQTIPYLQGTYVMDDEKGQVARMSHWHLKPQRVSEVTQKLKGALNIELVIGMRGG